MCENLLKSFIISINLCEYLNLIKLRPKRITISGKKWSSYKILMKTAIRAYYLKRFFYFEYDRYFNILKIEKQVWYGVLRYLGHLF